MKLKSETRTINNTKIKKANPEIRIIKHRKEILVEEDETTTLNLKEMEL